MPCAFHKIIAPCSFIIPTESPNGSTWDDPSTHTLPFPLPHASKQHRRSSLQLPVACPWRAEDQQSEAKHWCWMTSISTLPSATMFQWKLESGAVLLSSFDCWEKVCRCSLKVEPQQELDEKRISFWGFHYHKLSSDRPGSAEQTGGFNLTKCSPSLTKWSPKKIFGCVLRCSRNLVYA